MSKFTGRLRASYKFWSFPTIAAIAIFSTADSDCKGGGGGGPGNTLAGNILTCQCACLPCLAVNSAFTNACLAHDTFSDPNNFSIIEELQLCKPVGTVDASNAIQACTQACHDQSYFADINSRGGCRLANLTQVDTLTNVEFNACNTGDGNWAPALHFLSSKGSSGQIASSQSSLSFSGESGPLSGSGNIEFIASLAPNAFSVQSLEFDSPSTSLGGTSITNVHVVADALAGGTLTGTSFVIPKANVAGDVTALLSGSPQSFAVTADGDLTGTYDPVNKAWSINVNMEGSGAAVALHLQGLLTNISPVSDAGVPQTVECNLASGFGQATLDGGATTNPEGTSLTISWYNTVMGQSALLGTGTALGVNLPLGVNSITERSVSGNGAESTAQTSINVVHTLPPILSVPVEAQLVTACSPGATVKLPIPIAVDKCSASVNVTGRVTSANDIPVNISVGANGAVNVGPGPITVVWTALDADGLQSSVQQAFNVVTNPTLYARGSLQIDDGAQVIADGGFGTIDNIGSGIVMLEPQARSGDIRSAGNVTLNDRASVNGSVVTHAVSMISPFATITGTLTTGVAPVLPVFPSVATGFPPATSSLDLEPGQASSLSPGSYNSIIIKSRATLNLSAGTYFISSLDIEPQAVVKLDTSEGPVLLVVTNSWLQNGGTFADALHPVAALTVQYLGSNAISLGSPFAGTVIAPNVRLTLTTQSSGGFAGQFFAHDIEVAPNVTVTHSPLNCP